MLKDALPISTQILILEERIRGWERLASELQEVEDDIGRQIDQANGQAELYRGKLLKLKEQIPEDALALRTNRGRTINALGLVEREYEGFNVTSPGVKKEVFRVWRDEANQVRCSCEEATAHLGEEPPYRCEHMFAVKFHLEGTDDPATASLVLEEAIPEADLLAAVKSDPVAHKMGDMIKTSTLIEIRQHSHAADVSYDDVQAECKLQLGVRYEELNSDAGIAFLAHIQRKWPINSDNSGGL